MANILLGITGGIAAYKSAALVRSLSEAGHNVNVVITPNASRFIGAATLEALSGNRVTNIDPDLFSDVEQVKHVSLAQKADVVVVAPATASLMARVTSGIADDLVSSSVLAASCPVILAPAMHTEMWENQATQGNLAQLKSRGIIIVDPGVGRLTGEDSGVGRLAEVSEILAEIDAALGARALAGKRVLITAGGTREPIDDARYIGNFSSGKQGLAFAKAAKSLGAQVSVVGCNLEPLAGFESFVVVSTASELEAQVSKNLGEIDLLVMAAAVADYSPKFTLPGKLDRSLSEEITLDLVANPDILAKSVARIRDQRLEVMTVGFAAESGGDLAGLAASKLQKKGCDFLVANDISGGNVFGSDSNNVLFLGNGLKREISGSKFDVALAVLSEVAARMGAYE